MLTLSSDAAITAKFMPLPRLTVTAGPGGRVTSTPAGIDCTSGSSTGCAATFTEGTKVTLKAIANMGRTPDRWSGVCYGSILTQPCSFRVGGLGSQAAVSATFR